MNDFGKPTEPITCDDDECERDATWLASIPTSRSLDIPFLCDEHKAELEQSIANGEWDCEWEFEPLS